MKSLKPDATYIYERANSTIYARETGSTERIEIGWCHDPRTDDGRPMHDHLMDAKLWGEIRREARTNPALQHALDRVKIIYELSKKDGKK